MRKRRKAVPYLVRILEAQWDARHEQSVRPFFEELKRGREIYHKNPHKRDKLSTHCVSNPLHDYYVFQSRTDFSDLIKRNFRAGESKKILYVASHGNTSGISALGGDINVNQIKKALEKKRYEGIFFGACLFASRKNAEYILDNCNVSWVAGYERAVDWLASTINDILFFRVLLDGWFKMNPQREAYVPIHNVREAAECLFHAYRTSYDLEFNVFYRGKGPGSPIKDVRSSWEPSPA